MTSLARKIQSQIEQSGGWIATDVFMQAALYTPGLGYYCGGADPFGSSATTGQHAPARGDFVTGPMLGPWLAKGILAWAQPMRQAILERSMNEAFRIREFGGGRGDLAADLLRLARHDGQDPGPEISLELIELSADLQRRQEQATAGLG